VAPILGSVNYFSKVDPEVGYRLVTVVRVLAVVRFVLMGITCLRARPAKPLPA
jgi:hypothetical protein